MGASIVALSPLTGKGSFETCGVGLGAPFVSSLLVADGGIVLRPHTFRATPWEVKNTFVVEHGQLITSRWPGDAFEFSRRFLGMLEEVPRLY